MPCFLHTHLVSLLTFEPGACSTHTSHLSTPSSTVQPLYLTHHPYCELSSVLTFPPPLTSLTHSNVLTFSPHIVSQLCACLQEVPEFSQLHLVVLSEERGGQPETETHTLGPALQGCEHMTTHTLHYTLHYRCLL